MLTLKKILVPRDFSPCSEAGLRYALDLARRVGAEVHLLFAEVLYADAYAPTVTAEPAQEAITERLREGVEAAASLTIHHALVRDIAAAPAIVAYAAEHDVDLIVMGTHGRRGLRRLLLGSTAEEVVRTAPCPVFTAHTQAPATEASGTSILVPVDFSRFSRLALQHAKELARLYDARLDLLHVVEDSLHPAFYNTGVWSIYDVIPDIEERALDELKTFFRETDGAEVEVRFHVRRGHAAHEIVAFAGEAESRCVVMATHGLRGLEHFLLGSVTEKVVRRSPVPVFTVKAFGKALVPQPVLDEAEAGA